MSFSRVMVAVDFSASSLSALEYAREYALRLGGSLTVVHVTAATDDEAEARRTIERLLASQPPGLRPRVEVLRSDSPADAILNYASATGSDVLIIGMTRDARPWNFFMGSIAQQIVRRASCPVLTIRASVLESARATT